MRSPHVAVTLWGVGARQVPRAAARMALDRALLRNVTGLRFAKLLGTGNGRTFTLRDADPLHWGLLTVWDDDAAARAFQRSRTHRSWSRLADERLHVDLAPVASRGRWSRRAPFGDPAPRRIAGPVASLTRARLRMRRAPAFWRAVPPVSADLRAVTGLCLAVGIGETPIGLQGTFSLWDDERSLIDFAHRRPAHADVVVRTAGEGWYAEELFARFEVCRIEGTFAGRRPLEHGHA